jgi:Tol biopolymer transport system component
VVNGIGKPQLVGETNWIDTVSNDGRFLFFSVRGDDGLSQVDVTFLSLAGKAEQTPLLATDAQEDQVSLSPDGRYLAYRSDNDIYVNEVEIDGTELTLGARKKISSGGRWPQWSPKGNELFYLEADQLMSVPIEGDKTASGKATPLFRLSESVLLGEFYPYDVDSDGKRFLFVQHRPDQPAVQKITIAQNWFSEKAGNSK